MGKTSKVIVKGANPSVAVRATNQVEILKGLAADGVDDNVCLFDSDYVRKGRDKTSLGGRMGTSGAMKMRAQIVTGGAYWIVQVRLDESRMVEWCRHPYILYQGGCSADGNCHPRR